MQTILKQKTTVDDGKTKNKRSFQSLQSFHITEDQHFWLFQICKNTLTIEADPGEYASTWKTVEKTIYSIKSMDPNLSLVNDSDSELSELSEVGSKSDSPEKLSEEDNIDLDVN
ncbi:hypothetical protein Clacol_004249 [Clathrus columnatus]|uniref:Uncharacterized protein n=1 Tax=Clathrus columnatus TaxID=1419009 RepID=A0AAV5A986_9AGAM|nr:hypothetical protein Clacol_004249 [Clathrus columnatus]